MKPCVIDTNIKHERIKLNWKLESYIRRKRPMKISMNTCQISQPTWYWTHSKYYPSPWLSVKCNKDGNDNNDNNHKSMKTTQVY